MSDEETSQEPGQLKTALRNAFVRVEVNKANPIKYVALIDMLGFSALVKQFPGVFDVETDGDGSLTVTSTSESSNRFGQFHFVLDRMAMDHGDATQPERMMIFSDCAFAVYDNPLQAAVSLCGVMRRFLKRSIPVRMCLAKGTCHNERFSIEAFRAFTLTRSMFYGSGVVFAAEGEKKAGRGCRIFLHRILDFQDVASIQQRIKTIALDPPNEHAEHELNYLHELGYKADPEKADLQILAGLVQLQKHLRRPVVADVAEHYDKSFAAFNNMRQQFSRPTFMVPPVNATAGLTSPL